MLSVGISLTPALGCTAQKRYARRPSSAVLGREWQGCPAMWVGTSRDQKNFMQENLVRKVAERKLPEFCPEFCSEFSPNFSRTFRASFRGRRRPEKIHQKSPPFFQCKIPRQTRKKYLQNSSGEQAKKNLGLFSLPIVNQVSATPKGQRHWTGPNATSSNSNSSIESLEASSNNLIANCYKWPLQIHVSVQCPEFTH